MAILDLSKKLMYDFHYNFARKKWKKIEFCFTDTDSLSYEIETEDVFKDIAEDVEEKFDTSDFEKEPFLGFPVGKNKKKVGFFKDEACGKQIAEFCGHSFLPDGKEKTKCKGVSKAAVGKKITFQDNKYCLFSRKEAIRDMNVIRSRNHELFSETVLKIALNCDDDKRFILEDGIGILA